MKTLMIALSMFAGASAQAAPASFQLPRGTIGSYPLTQVSSRVEAVMPNCPPNAMCAPLSKLHVTATLNGCVDRLGPVTFEREERTRDGKIHLYVAALGLANEASQRTRCVVAPTARFELNLGMGFLDDSSVELHMVSGRGTNTTADLRGAESLKIAQVLSTHMFTPPLPVCRPGRPCPRIMPYSHALVRVALGCRQTLGPVLVTSSRENLDGKVDVYLTATVAQAPRSFNTVCTRELRSVEVQVPVAPGILTDANARVHVATQFAQ